MITRHSGKILLLAALTVFVGSGCRPANLAATQEETAWRTTKTGSFDKNHVFYGQFGAAPFDIAVSTPAGPARAGTQIRYRIFSDDRKAVIFTVSMEKQANTVNAEGGWVFQATDGTGKPIATDGSCVACHRQQAGNDYLFSLSADRLE